MPEKSIGDVVEFMSRFAPLDLSEDWDNVGLLVGDEQQAISRVMTCLTLTLDVAEEAVQRGADLVISHHPLPFRPLKRITADNVTGQVLLKLMRQGIAIHSPHTSFDSAPHGINQRIAEGLGLQNIVPIRPIDGDERGLGAGRWGSLPEEISAADLIAMVKEFFSIGQLHRVGEDRRPVRNVAVACGAAGEFLADALNAGCEAFITGESNFHTCLQARTDKIELILPGHYATERFAVEALAEVLAGEFSELDCWASEVESDPLSWS